MGWPPSRATAPLSAISKSLLRAVPSMEPCATLSHVNSRRFASPLVPANAGPDLPPPRNHPSYQSTASAGSAGTTLGMGAQCSARQDLTQWYVYSNLHAQRAVPAQATGDACLAGHPGLTSVVPRLKRRLLGCCDTNSIACYLAAATTSRMAKFGGMPRKRDAGMRGRGGSSMAGP